MQAAKLNEKVTWVGARSGCQKMTGCVEKMWSKTIHPSTIRYANHYKRHPFTYI